MYLYTSFSTLLVQCNIRNNQYICYLHCCDKDMPKSLFNGERFLTDEELSKVLRVSRRTLQEYRTFGVVPYYMMQGKALYKESDILKILDDAYKRCREEQRWV